MLMMPRNRQTTAFSPLSLLFLLVALRLLVCPALTYGLSTNDQLSDPQSVSSIDMDKTTSGQPDVVGTNLSRAEYNLKLGAWQEAAQHAQFVLTKEKDNVKAHAVLGLIAALGGQQEQAEQALVFLQSNHATDLYPELIAAVLYGQKNNFIDAQKHLAVALHQEPEHPVALYYSGSLELAQGNLAQAEKAFLAVLHRSPDFAPALAGLGQVYWRGNQADKAVAAYQKAIAVEPDTLLYRQQLIAIYKATGQKDAENAAATEMLYFVPGVKERSLEQAMELLNRGEYDATIKQADTLLHVYKQFPVSHYLKAVAFINKGDGEAARKSIADFLNAGSRTVKTHHEAGLCYLALGDLDKAEEQFKLAIALQPDNGRTFVFLPIIEQLRGHRDRAINGLSLMLAQKEHAPLIHYLQANNYLADGKTDEYRQEMQQGVELVPGLKDEGVQSSQPSNSAVEVANNRNLMVLFFLNGWYEQTVRKSAIVLKTRTSDPFALWYHGLARMAQKRYPDAVSSLKKLVEIDPKITAPSMQLGQAYALMRDAGNALATFRKATEISPSHAPAYIGMGDMYFQMGNNAEAVQSYRKAIEIHPESSQAYPPLVLLLAEQPATIGEAKQLAEKAVALTPHDPAALDALGWVYIQQGEPKVGIEKLQQALGAGPQAPYVMYHLGVGYYQDNQPDQAKLWLEAALALTKEFRGNDQAQEILKKIKPNR